MTGFFNFNLQGFSHGFIMCIHQQSQLHPQVQDLGCAVPVIRYYKWISYDIILHYIHIYIIHTYILYIYIYTYIYTYTYYIYIFVWGHRAYIILYPHFFGISPWLSRWFAPSAPWMEVVWPPAATTASSASGTRPGKCWQSGRWHSRPAMARGWQGDVQCEAPQL